MRAVALSLLLLACSPSRSSVREAPTEPTALPPEKLEALTQAYRDVRGAASRQDWPAAAAAFTRALELNPGDDSLVYSVASLCAQTGRVEEAFGWLERLPALESTLVPQAPDFPGLTGERFTRLTERLQRNAPLPHASVAFTLPQRDLLPEGIAYDAKTDTFFLSSIRLRKVVAVGPDGAARDFATQGLMSTLGMRVDPERRLLWVASTYTDSMKDARPEDEGRSTLVAYDLDTARERARLPRGGDGKASLLNDLAVARDGTVYVTDSEAGEVLRLAPDARDFEVLVPTGTRFYPNGIALSDDGRTLFFADFVYGVSVLRLDTGALSTLSHPPGVSTHGFDGLAFHEGALIGVENGSGPGRVVRLPLAPEHDRALGAQVLEAAHPLARIPTTGVLARGAFFLVVDSQLRAAPGGKLLPWEQLSEVHVVRVPLTR